MAVILWDSNQDKTRFIGQDIESFVWECVMFDGIMFLLPEEKKNDFLNFLQVKYLWWSENSFRILLSQNLRFQWNSQFKWKIPLLPPSYAPSLSCLSPCCRWKHCGRGCACLWCLYEIKGREQPSLFHSVLELCPTGTRRSCLKKRS